MDEVLDRRIEQVATQIRELETLQQELRSLRVQCDGVAAECVILDGRRRVKVSTRAAGAPHPRLRADARLV